MLNLGRAQNGKVVHVIVTEEDNRQLCDKKKVKLAVDKTLKITDLTCKKCLGYAVVKKEKADNAEALLKVIKKTAKDSKQKPVTGIPTKKKTSKADKVKVAATKPEKVDKTIKTPKADKAEKKIERAFRKKKISSDNFSIVHVATGTVFFSKLGLKIARMAVRKLNKIELKWESVNDRIPKDFVSRCRHIMCVVYKKADMKVPAALSATKLPRVIKRRQSDGKKALKDKKKTVAKPKGTESSKYFDFMIKKMQKGISFAELAQAVKDEFGLKSKRANGRVRGHIRKLRRKEISVVIELKKDKLSDVYKLVSD